MLAAVLFGIGAALCSPALSAFISDRTDPNVRGTVFGFFYGAFDAGVIVAGAILGIVSDLAGLREMFVITAFGGCISLALFSLLIRKGYRRSVQWTLGIKKP
ncbi:MAG: MFS transporter [Desulfobacterales bacterium]|nr:MFS transporter [Desulfobacterales bacterium]